MTIISYAQNFEDVMLARALGSIGKGFYVDVGAQHPSEHSVTKAFYDQGWSGINLEPVAQWHQMLHAERPRDTNLQVAVGDRAGTLKFYSIEGTGLSTADAEIALKHEREGWNVSETEVPVKTLAAILEENSVREIHFLKVDVEGFEKQVLEGADFSRFRPWIVLVEATRPLSVEQSHQSWDSLISGAGYQFAYFDGLNRFYVANEHSDLLDRFSAPPNCFDDYIRFSEWHCQAQVREFSERLRQTERALVTTQSALDGAQVAAASATARLQDDLRRNEEIRGREIEAVRSVLSDTLNSASWRITRPLREAMIVARSGFRFLSRSTLLRRVAAFLTAPFPRLKHRIVRQLFGGSPLQEKATMVASVSSSARGFIRLYESVLATERKKREQL